MSEMNFFSWLRNSVRQSVLLGVNDAVEQLGTPATDTELNPQVAGFLQLDRGAGEINALPAAKAKTGTRKKRLGKSLKDLGQEEKPS